MQAIARGVWQGRAFRAAATAALIGASLLSCLPRRSAQPSAAAILGAFRPCAGRLTGLSYAPAGVPTVLSLDQRIELRRLQVKLASDQSPRALSSRAVLGLMAGKAAASRELLTEASRLAPVDPDVASDLAASLLAVYAEEGDPRSLLQALAATDRALQLAPGLPEALFNRALACEKLFLDGCAERDWSAVATSPGEPGWREEAWQHLRHRAPGEAWESRSTALEQAALREPRRLDELVRQSRASARKLVEDDLLGRWANGVVRGQQSLAAAPLEAAWRLALALQQTTGDPLLYEAVAFVMAASASASSTSREHELAAGHAAFGRGRGAYRRGDYQEAAMELALAARQLGAVGSPFAPRARFWLACAEHYSGRRLTAASEFAAVERIARRHHYLALLGDSLWMEGLASSERADLGTALAHYREAIATFKALAEPESEAGAENLTAEVLDLAGEWSDGWRFRLAALAHGHDTGDLQRRLQLDGVAAAAAEAQGCAAAALHFLDEAVQVSHRLGNADSEVHALTARCRVEGRLGKQRQAVADGQRALELSSRIGSKEAQAWARAGALEAAAALLPVRERVPPLTEALALAETSGERDRTFTLLLARAAALAGVGEPRQAAVDLERAISLTETWRSKLLTLDQRIAFLERSREAFDVMVDLQFERLGDPGTALSYLEQGRARALAEAVDSTTDATDTPARPEAARLTVAAAARQLPRDTALVVCSVVRSRMLVWLVDRMGLRSASSTPLTPALEAAIEHLRRGPSVTPPDQLAAAGTLVYTLLIAPIHGYLRADMALVFDVDERLQTIPFSLLCEPLSGRYLIEDFQIHVTPSAKVFLGCARGAAHRPWRTGSRVLVVGDPAPGAVHLSNLADLPGAREEAHAIAALYPQATELSGLAASPEAFLEGARQASVIHFAGHTVIDSRIASESRLVLAPDKRGAAEGALRLREVAALHLDETHLVVLATCGGAAGPARGLEGVESLARAFLAAGVPTVVAALWPVDDTVSARFFVDFHRRLRAGAQPVEALRAAQLAMLRQTTGSAADRFGWAAFQLMGA